MYILYTVFSTKPPVYIVHFEQMKEELLYYRIIETCIDRYYYANDIILYSTYLFVLNRMRYRNNKLLSIKFILFIRILT